MSEVKNIKHSCFVCQRKVSPENSEINKEVYLPVCTFCKGTPEEKDAFDKQLYSSADGLICGCI